MKRRCTSADIKAKKRDERNREKRMKKFEIKWKKEVAKALKKKENEKLNREMTVAREECLKANRREKTLEMRKAFENKHNKLP